MNIVSIFSKATGLNNAVEPAKLTYDPKSGVGELAHAYNVDIDVSGRVSRRKGFTATSRTESVYSLYSNGFKALYMSSDSLYILNADYSRTGIRSGMTIGARVSYCCPSNVIYYANGVENGFVDGVTSYPWTKGTYIGPVTIKQFVSPPVGHLLCYFNSRIYIAVDSAVFYSEPFGYSLFDLARNYIQLGSKVKMIRAVDDGIYAGDDSGVYFLSGTNPAEFDRKKVSDSPVVVGTDVEVKGEVLSQTNLFGGKTKAENAVVWTAQDGIYVGFNKGESENLTKNKLIYPASQVGCSVFDRSTNRFITLLQ